ncbi:MAG TPA: hypothetical protein VF614_00505, partial [Chthoniobacteraceae bacterium]
MKGAPRHARWRHTVLFLGAGLLAGLTYDAATAPEYTSRSVVRLSPEAGRSEQIARELRAPGLIEATGRKLGLRATAREIETDHLREFTIQPENAASLAVIIRARSGDLAAKWTETIVAEYLRGRGSASAPPKESTGPNPKRGTEEDPERVQNARVLDGLGQLRIQLRDPALRTVEKLSRISDFQKAHAQPDGKPLQLINEELLQQLAARWRDFQQRLQQSESAQIEEDRRAANAELLRIQEALGAELASAEKQIATTFQVLIERRNELGQNGTSEAEARAPFGRLTILAPPPAAAATAKPPITEVKLVSLTEPALLRRVWIYLSSLAAAGLLGAILPRVAHARRRRRYDSETLERTLQLRHLGSIPGERHSQIPLVGGPRPPADQFRAAFQKLASTLHPESPRSAPVYTVTSANRGEGKTVVAANLGVALASTGRRVLIVDVHSGARPLSRLFGFRPRARLAELLSAEIRVADALQTTTIPRVTLLAAGGGAL